jgi:hypothetical protein
MPSLSAKDRVSLCQFTFADGRRCRTPRTGKNPHFCFDHAQKEARALAEESLSKDLSYFFSGDYLSACDLSTALGRLIPAVLRGDVKPRTARTVAYLAQTLLQTIHLSKHEYINAFDTDNWRDSIRKSVKGNYNHRFPPAPKREQPASPQPQNQPQPHAPQHAETPRASQRSSREPGSATANHASPSAATPPLPGPASIHFPATGSQPTPSSPLPTARPTTSPIQSSTGAHHSPQQQSELQAPAASPSATRQEPQPTAGPQTGPSGLPLLAPLPPRHPGVSPGSRSS